MTHSIGLTVEDLGAFAHTFEANVDEVSDMMCRLGVIGVEMEDVGLIHGKCGITSLGQTGAKVLATHEAKAHHDILLRWNGPVRLSTESYEPVHLNPEGWSVSKLSFTPPWCGRRSFTK